MARVLSLGGLFIIFYTDYNNLLIQGYSLHMDEHCEWFSTAVLCDVSLVSEAHPLIVTLKCKEMKYRWLILQLTNAENTTFSAIWSYRQSLAGPQSVCGEILDHTHALKIMDIP